MVGFEAKPPIIPYVSRVVKLNFFSNPTLSYIKRLLIPRISSCLFLMGNLTY